VTSADDLAAPDDLRQLVREVLREVLPALADRKTPAIREDAQTPVGLDRGGLEAANGQTPPRGFARGGLEAADGQTPAGLARGGLEAAGVPPPRPPTSVPGSDSDHVPPDGATWPAPGTGSRQDNPMDVTFMGLQPGESHIHGVRRPGRAAQPPAGPGSSRQAVRLSTDEELHAFVLQVLRLADNPKRRRDLLAGRLRFTLATGSGGQGEPSVTQRVDKGAVTERAVIAAATAGARLVLGPRAVLTPLARDKARALGVPVEKER
jgi:hypothetical protein